MAIVGFHHQYPLEGYRRLTFLILDRDIVAVSPSATYRVLREAGLLAWWKNKVSKKGTGFKQPLFPHDHPPVPGCCAGKKEDHGLKCRINNHSPGQYHVA